MELTEKEWRAMETRARLGHLDDNRREVREMLAKARRKLRKTEKRADRALRRLEAQILKDAIG